MYCRTVKYADLKNHRTTNYRFSYDDMLSQQVRVYVVGECWVVVGYGCEGRQRAWLKRVCVCVWSGQGGPLLWA